MIFLDTETIGFHGFIALLQYAKDNETVQLYHIWDNPVKDTLKLLEDIANNDICGFNLVFDWFHIVKCYTTFSLLEPDFIPIDDIDLVAVMENEARFLDLTIKPKSACDILLHAQKGPYQSLMDRRDIRIKRIPTRLVEAVRRELEKKIELDGIYFAKKKKNRNDPHWTIRDTDDPEFKDIILKFNATTRLKELAKHAFKLDDDLVLSLVDVGVNKSFSPVEIGYAPFALAIGKPGDWKKAWPMMVKEHVAHWKYNPLAQRYAVNDVKYTRDLYHFFGLPRSGDDDSELACSVGAARWRGFAINIEKLKEQRQRALEKTKGIPIAPRQAKAYLSEVMTEAEQITLKTGTKAVLLESIAGKEDPDGNWDFSKGWGQEHPAAQRAKQILEARRNTKVIEVCDKLIRAGRLHASLKIIGTLSSRMSGTDRLNTQGIKARKDFRICFPLADFDKGFVLSGGDFVSFEIVLAAAVYNDPQLEADLKAGKSIHGLFAVELFELDYDTIMKTKATSTYYTDGKRGIFSQLYGGNEHTLQTRLGISSTLAHEASQRFYKQYPGVKKARDRIQQMFCSMQQPGGIGTPVVWHEPHDYIESLFGFRRYFTLENKICKALFNLAENLPKNWQIPGKIKRRDRFQTFAGSVRSALYAAAFNIQASNLRAAANHEIQSSGAGATKHVQRKIGDLQPVGVGPIIVQTLNVHDEIHVVTKSEYIDVVSEVVKNTVESFRNKVPLIEMDWNKTETSWGDK